MTAPTTTTASAKLWTKAQVVGAVERAGLAALGAFTGALVVTNTAAGGLEHSAIAAGVAAGVAFLAKLGAYLSS